MTVAITGANGFLGSLMANAFTERGASVRSFVRRPNTESEEYFELGRPVSKDAFLGCTALIHCAYDFRPTRWDSIRRTNIEGAERTIEAALSAGIRTVINISTISAFDGCKSNYGKAKLLIENLPQKSEMWSIRPGLIFSRESRGMFGRLIKASRLPVIPLVSNGSQVQYLSYGPTIAAIVADECISGISHIGEISVFANPTPIQFRTILVKLAERQKKHPLFISIPYTPLFYLMRGVECCGIPLPFKSDSLNSLLNQDPSPEFDSRFIFPSIEKLDEQNA